MDSPAYCILIPICCKDSPIYCCTPNNSCWTSQNSLRKRKEKLELICSCCQHFTGCIKMVYMITLKLHCLIFSIVWMLIKKQTLIFTLNSCLSHLIQTRCHCNCHQSTCVTYHYKAFCSSSTGIDSGIPSQCCMLLFNCSLLMLSTL